MRAFLLLKPDCLRRGLGGAVERAVEAAGLTVDERLPITLSPADVRYLWSEYSEAGHSLMLGFLDRYLTTGPSVVLLVSGPDAFEATRRVKREIRSRYADGPFANVVHAAEQPGELARQRDHLLGLAETGPADTGPPRTSPPRTGPADTGPLVSRTRPAGLDFRVLFDVPTLVGELWPRVQGIPADPGPHRLDDGTGTVVLRPDREHTLDSTVTALWHALPGIEPPRAVLLALHSGWSGGTPVAIGSTAARRRCMRILRENGIRHCFDQT